VSEELIIMMSFRRFAWNNRFCIGYVALSSFLLVLIVLLQSYRHNIFGTKLLLGWDSPGYVWEAQDLIRYGPLYMMVQWNFPQFYVHLLAFLGYVSGNVITVERILPSVFGALLIYANFQVTRKITNSVHFAGLAAILTVFSLNFLRLLADLNRNLMAFSLSMISLLLVPNLESKGSFLNRKYLVFILLLLVISGTQFETYFILSLSLVLYGFLTKDWKNIVMLTLACIVPVAILIPLFPVYFFGYTSAVVFLARVMTIDDFVMWTGGSWILAGFFIIAAFCLFRRLTQRRDKLALLFSSYFLVIVSLVVLIVLTRALPVDFAIRVMLVLPIPILLALAAQTLRDSVSDISIDLKAFSAKTKHMFRISSRRLLLLILVPILVGSSLIVSLQHVDAFLIPYVPRLGYEKLLTASEFLGNNGFSQPVVVYYGYPAIWHVSLYRNYFGAELGEHFSYYGSIENLFRLIPSEPVLKGDVSLMEFERYYSTLYYKELIGNWSGLIPPTYSHRSYISSVKALMAHPIIIITPEFYNDEVPYYIRPFHIGEGIYIIPPNSLLNVGEAMYGPSVSVYRDGAIDLIRSEYLYADPIDPSLIILRVNGSSGYDSYNFTNIPSDWTFIRIEQGGDLSFPETDPKRLDSVPALNGNDPADSAEDWTSPQAGEIQADQDTKKEGFASLKVMGAADYWGNLGVTYNFTETQDLGGYAVIAVWAKSTEDAAFSMTLRNSPSETRTYWGIEAGGSSATTGWKRFVVDLGNYTQQTPNFDIAAVDSIDLYVSSDPGKEISLWIDDLTVDNIPESNASVYKARVLVNDTVILYLAVRETLHDNCPSQDDVRYSMG
jgi:hypothetical protein